MDLKHQELFSPVCVCLCVFVCVCVCVCVQGGPSPSGMSLNIPTVVQVGFGPSPSSMTSDLEHTHTHTHTHTYTHPRMAQSVMLPNSPKVGCRRCVHCNHQIAKMTEVFCKCCLILAQTLCDAALNLCRADW